MIEFVLVLSNLILLCAILGYFFLREIKNKQDDDKRIVQFDNFYSRSVDKMQSLFDKQLSTLQELSLSKDNLTIKVLNEYLKHNEKLEKMVLPQPVTRKAVEDILNRGPEVIPNDIEKSDKELEQDQFQDLLANVPITANTKVVFENDGSFSAGGSFDDLSSDNAGLVEEIEK